MPVGITARLSERSDGDLARVVSRLRSAGVDYVKEDVSWRTLEPSRGVYDWSSMDRWVAAAAGGGLRIIALPCDAPRWATAAVELRPGERQRPARRLLRLRSRAGRALRQPRRLLAGAPRAAGQADPLLRHLERALRAPLLGTRVPGPRRVRADVQGGREGGEAGGSRGALHAGGRHARAGDRLPRQALPRRDAAGRPQPRLLRLRGQRPPLPGRRRLAAGVLPPSTLARGEEGLEGDRARLLPHRRHPPYARRRRRPPGAGSGSPRSAGRARPAPATASRRRPRRATCARSSVCCGRDTGGWSRAWSGTSTRVPRTIRGTRRTTSAW